MILLCRPEAQYLCPEMTILSRFCDFISSCKYDENNIEKIFFQPKQSIAPKAQQPSLPKCSLKEFLIRLFYGDYLLNIAEILS